MPETDTFDLVLKDGTKLQGIPSTVTPDYLKSIGIGPDTSGDDAVHALARMKVGGPVQQQQEMQPPPQTQVLGPPLSRLAGNLTGFGETLPEAGQNIKNIIMTLAGAAGRNPEAAAKAAEMAKGTAKGIGEGLLNLAKGYVNPQADPFKTTGILGGEQLKKGIDQIKSGDVAGGIGTLGNLGLSYALGGKKPELRTEMVAGHEIPITVGGQAERGMMQSVQKTVAGSLLGNPIKAQVARAGPAVESAIRDIAQPANELQARAQGMYGRVFNHPDLQSTHVSPGEAIANMTPQQKMAFFSNPSGASLQTSSAKIMVDVQPVRQVAKDIDAHLKDVGAYSSETLGKIKPVLQEIINSPDQPLELVQQRRSSIGRILDQMSDPEIPGKGGTGERISRKLYGAYSDAMKSTITKADPSLVPVFENANKLWARGEAAKGIEQAISSSKISNDGMLQGKTISEYLQNNEKDIIGDPKNPKVSVAEYNDMLKTAKMLEHEQAVSQPSRMSGFMNWALLGAAGGVAAGMPFSGHLVAAGGMAAVLSKAMTTKIGRMSIRNFITAKPGTAAFWADRIKEQASEASNGQ